MRKFLPALFRLASSVATALFKVNLAAGWQIGGTDVNSTAAEIDAACDGTTAKNSHTHTLADGATDVTASSGEINTVCDGATAKNSHTHTLADGATDVTVAASDVNDLLKTNNSRAVAVTLVNSAAAAEVIPLSMTTPNVTLPGFCTLLMGTNLSNYNSMALRHKTVSAGSTANYVGIGHYGNGDLVKIFGTGEVFGNGFATKVVEIGDWDMNVSVAGSAVKDVTHGLTLSKIIGVRVIIRRDDDAERVHFGKYITGVKSGIGSFNATTLTLAVIAGDYFDSTDFDATSYNRGFVLIDYTE